VVNRRVSEVRTLLFHSSFLRRYEEPSLGLTPLLWACANGNLELVTLLLDHPSITHWDLNRADWRGFCPLVMSCLHGHTEVVKLLLAQPGLDRRVLTSSKGTSPLLAACVRGNVELVSLLLGLEGVDRNHVNSFGETPLISAFLHRNFPVLRLLLQERQTDVNKAGPERRSLFSFCCQSGEREMFDLLLRLPNLDINKFDCDFRTPLWHASRHNQVYFVGKLLQCPHLDVNQDAAVRDTPLFVACDRNHVGVVALLARDPRVNVMACDMNKRSPFTRACRNGHVEAVKTLLSSGREVISLTSSDDLEIAFVGACASSVEMAQYLLESPLFQIKANAAMVEKGAWKAIAEGNVDVFMFLLPYLQTLEPIALCRLLRAACTRDSVKNTTVIRELLNLPGLSLEYGNLAFGNAVRSRNWFATMMVLRHPTFYPNRTTARMDAALHVVVEEKTLGLLRELLRHPGLSLTVLDTRARTPLCVAVRKRLLLTCRWLLAFYPVTPEAVETVVEANTLQGPDSIAALLQEFIQNPARKRAALRNELGVADEFAADNFALGVFLCDGFLRLVNPDTPAGRFFRILERLPLELQMMLCGRQAGSVHDSISKIKIEEAFLRIGRDLSNKLPGDLGIFSVSDESVPYIEPLDIFGINDFFNFDFDLVNFGDANFGDVNFPDPF